MGPDRKLWLVHNATSGSNTREALETLQSCCGRAGFDIARTSVFPEEPAPSPQDLADEDIDLVAIFAGDGTINAVVTSLYGWDGEILVLPGGTMNLLCKRLHGEESFEKIVELAATARGRRVRPTIARTSKGDALAGLLAGPGTAWNEVREALRATDVVGIVEGAGEALGESTGGSMLVCETPELGSRDGYPLIMLTPVENALAIDGYYAETIGEYIKQGWALLTRNFREGPHDSLGIVEELTVQDSDDEPIGLLLDGEPRQGQSRETFRLAECEVDLLATAHG